MGGAGETGCRSAAAASDSSRLSHLARLHTPASRQLSGFLEQTSRSLIRSRDGKQTAAAAAAQSRPACDDLREIMTMIIFLET